MANICCCWELGAGIGHVVNLLPVAIELRERGHNIKWIIPSGQQAAALLTKANFEFVTLPINRAASAITSPKTFAEILCGIGYLDAKDLKTAVLQWRTIFIQFQTELIITEYAPTALLASKSLHLLSAKLGPSFTFPPQKFPMPSFRSWEKIAKNKLMHTEAKVLDTVNEVQNYFNVDPLPHLHLMLRTDETFLTTFPDFDEYGVREDEVYLGTPASYGGGAKIIWPDGPGEKIFGYLKSDFADLILVLDELGNTFLPTVVCVLGASDDLVSLYSRPKLKVINYLIDFDVVAQNAEVIIAHGTGTIAAALLAGIPTIVLPMNIEQYIRGEITERLGVGANYTQSHSRQHLSEVVLQIAISSGYKLHAQNFAKKYSGFEQSTLTRRIANRCEKILLLT